jgi:hypothetical protein
MSVYLFIGLALVIGALLAAAIFNDARATARRLDGTGFSFGGGRRW